MALIFGAPERVPAGKAASRTSKQSKPFFKTPRTLETICMTWEYRSILKLSSTSTVLISATRPRSFLPRSTSMMCSASSFSSLNKSFSSTRSSSSFFPRLRVPAMGRTSTFSSSNRTRTSGEEPTTCSSPNFR